jgi:IclR family acetate operon transcriptional repressor
MEVKQAANVLELLQFFADRGRLATLADISKHFSWPRSSTFNLLGTLAARGFLYEPYERGRFYPSPKWMTLLSAIERQAPIPVPLRQLLQTLSRKTGETAVLAAISGNQALFIDRIESQHAVRYTAEIGKTVPIHVTATGRALLAQLSPADRLAVLKKARFERFTSRTLMDIPSIEREIARSLKRGWFEGAGEYTADLGGVAVPLSLAERYLAVMVGGPMHRIKPRYPEVAALLIQEVDKLRLSRKVA